MRLISWNVNSIRARLPRVLELLDEHQPTVLCVQETKTDTDRFPAREIDAAGYQVVERSEGRWNGVALLVRAGAGIEDVRSVLPDDPAPQEARWVEAAVDGVRVVSVYVPNGRDVDHPMFAVKLRFLEAMAARMAALRAAGPAVVAGDLNVAPEDRDVWDVAAAGLTTHVTDDERGRFRALLAQGFDDAFRVTQPDAPGFTWWDYRAGAFARGRGLRIDLALASHDLQIQGADVDTTFRRRNAAGDRPSDHAPLVVDLEVPGERR